MKFRIKSALLSAITIFGVSVNAFISEGIGEGLCTIDNRPVIFQEKPGSIGIRKGYVNIDEDASLTYYYNIYYQIGGTVTLKTKEGEKILIRWDNGFSNDLPFGSLNYNGQTIECKLDSELSTQKEP